MHWRVQIGSSNWHIDGILLEEAGKCIWQSHSISIYAIQTRGEMGASRRDGEDIAKTTRFASLPTITTQHQATIQSSILSIILCILLLYIIFSSKQEFSIGFSTRYYWINKLKDLFATTSNDSTKIGSNQASAMRRSCLDCHFVPKKTLRARHFTSIHSIKRSFPMLPAAGSF